MLNFFLLFSKILLICLREGECTQAGGEGQRDKQTARSTGILLQGSIPEP